jgi:hypothetical protein
MLAKNPGFSLIAILSIAVGVGANAAMFSVADGIMLRPLPILDATGLMTVSATLPPGVESLTVAAARVDETYVDTIGIPIVTGRGIQATDTADTPRVAVVSNGMAARYWPGEIPWASGSASQVPIPCGPRSSVLPPMPSSACLHPFRRRSCISPGSRTHRRETPWS